MSNSTAIFAKQGATTTLDAAINYPEVYALVADVVTGEPCKLVEALAERIAEQVGTHCAPVELVVRVRKPNPPSRRALRRHRSRNTPVL